MGAGAGVTTRAAEEGLRAGVTTEAAEEGLRAGVTEAGLGTGVTAAAAAEGLGAGVTEAEEEQAEETAETSEGAGRERRVVLLGLLGVGVAARTRRLVTSPSGAAAAAFRCRLVAPDFGLVSDAGAAAAALFEVEGLIVGVSTACGGEWESAVDSESGEREGELRGEGNARRRREMEGLQGKVAEDGCGLVVFVG